VSHTRALLPLFHYCCIPRSSSWGCVWLREFQAVVMLSAVQYRSMRSCTRARAHWLGRAQLLRITLQASKHTRSRQSRGVVRGFNHRMLHDTTRCLSSMPEVDGSAPAEVVLHVRGMKCGGCVSGVQRRLGEVDGVEEASANLLTGMTTVRIGPGAADSLPDMVPAMLAALGQGGYGGSKQQHVDAPLTSLACSLPARFEATVRRLPRQATATKLVVENVKCGSCVARIKGVLLEDPSIGSVNVNQLTGHTSISPSPGHAVDPSAVIDTLAAAGFPSRVADGGALGFVAST